MIVKIIELVGLDAQSTTKHLKREKRCSFEQENSRRLPT
jgi:hypothetical protein